MTYPVYPASKQILSEQPKRQRASKYPWHTLKLGMAFVVSDSEITYPSLLTLARRSGARHNRVYRVYHHKNDNVFEVAYVEDTQKPTANVEQVAVQIAPANVVLDEVRQMGEKE